MALALMKADIASAAMAASLQSHMQFRSFATARIIHPPSFRPAQRCDLAHPP
jgi:hypothetical protein